MRHPCSLDMLCLPAAGLAAALTVAAVAPVALVKVFLGARVQEVELSSAVNVPAAQGVQLVTPRGDQWPAGQTLHVDCKAAGQE